MKQLKIVIPSNKRRGLLTSMDYLLVDVRHYLVGVYIVEPLNYVHRDFHIMAPNDELNINTWTSSFSILFRIKSNHGLDTIATVLFRMKQGQ